MKKVNFCMLLIVCGLCLPNGINARQYSLQGSISLENDYNSNVFNTKDGHIDEWNSMLSPTLTLDSPGPSDNFSLVYAPTFSQNYRRDEGELEYGGLSLSADKALSGKWNLSFADSFNYYEGPVFEANTSLSRGQQFLRSDDATQAEIVRLLFSHLVPWDGSQMTEVLAEIDTRYAAASFSVRSEVDTLFNPASSGQSRQRYWSNAMSIASDYEFARNSTLTLGYSFDVHDEKTGTRADSVAHSPNVSVSYEISPQWVVQGGYAYGYTDYDSSNDSKSDDIDLSLEFTPQPSTTYSVSYAFGTIDYDGDVDNLTTQSTTLGTSHQIDQQTNINGDLGLSYESRDTVADDRGVTFNASLGRTISQGAVSVDIGLDYGETSSNGSWIKLNDGWNLGGGLQYDLWQDVSTTLDFSYERRNSWTTTEKTTYDDYGVGAGLSYPFLRWFVVSVNYDYHLFETTGTSIDDYNEHLVSVSLSASKELIRW